MRVRRCIYNVALIAFGLVATFVISFLLLRIAYPKKYSDSVRECALIYGVDEELIYAIIRCESNFDIDAVSSAGAVGLMQLTYDTVCWVAGRNGEQIPDESVLTVPEINIRYGVEVFAVLAEEFDDIGVSLAAYNAGRTRVLKWLADSRCSKDGILLEYIPYPETDNYVTKVLRTVEIYKLIY